MNRATHLIWEALENLKTGGHDVDARQRTAREIFGLLAEEGRMIESVAIADVIIERRRQDVKFPEQMKTQSDLFYLLAILGEEVGEVNRAALECRASGQARPMKLREELIEVAAVAVKLVELYDAKLISVEVDEDFQPEEAAAS